MMHTKREEEGEQPGRIHEAYEQRLGDPDETVQEGKSDDGPDEPALGAPASFRRCRGVGHVRAVPFSLSSRNDSVAERGLRRGRQRVGVRHQHRQLPTRRVRQCAPESGHAG